VRAAGEGGPLSESFYLLHVLSTLLGCNSTKSYEQK
jgi:hypothetical protein